MGEKIIFSKSIVKIKLYLSLIIIKISFLFFLSSCGYTIKGGNPKLPNEANSIAILPVQNQTFIAGLETDLSEQVNHLLHSNSSLNIVPSGIADLQLIITLIDIKTSSSELSNEQISSGIKATIIGKTDLIDRRIKKNIWKNLIITVNLTESLENEMETTSGISISGRTRQVIKLFALEIYDRLFASF